MEISYFVLSFYSGYSDTAMLFLPIPQSGLGYLHYIFYLIYLLQYVNSSSIVTLNWVDETHTYGIWNTSLIIQSAPPIHFFVFVLGLIVLCLPRVILLIIELSPMELIPPPVALLDAIDSVTLCFFSS